MAKKSSVINVAITGDAKKLKTALDTAERRVGSFSSNVGETMSRFGTAVAVGLGAAGTAVATKGVTAFAGFEKGMSVMNDGVELIQLKGGKRSGTPEEC